MNKKESLMENPSIDNPGKDIQIAKVYDKPFFWCYDFSQLKEKIEHYKKIASDLNSIIPILSKLEICNKENIMLYAETSRSQDKVKDFKDLKTNYIAQAADLMEGTSTSYIVVATLQNKDIIDDINCNILIPEFDEEIVSWNGNNFIVNEEPIRKECEVWVQGKDLEAWNTIVELVQVLNKITEKDLIANFANLGSHIPFLMSGGIIEPTTRNVAILLNRHVRVIGKMSKW